MQTMTNTKTIYEIIKALNSVGITNKYLQAGILATISKETNFVPNRENLNYTSSERLLQVFPSYFSSVADTLPYLNNPILLANKVYGGRGGNNLVNDGWDYRGGAYNQVTFKNTFGLIGDQLGIDLRNNPSLIDKYPEKITAQYFLNSFNSNSGKEKMKNVYNVDSINDIKDLNTGVLIALNSNAGWGKNVNTVLGKETALQIAPSMLKLVESSETEVKKKF